ncbi:MAG: hypothetical protein R3280_12445 [Marinobacter sp.]|uniref:hypothetical protein n=1 Tax=Marinobacter sp. TaxID=50741 RepID=UPI00299EE89C|nr:hypothetical protein [Marinobacter sp.]MDX1635442.1 hypothetical protein [Marinobacter sp.]
MTRLACLSLTLSFLTLAGCGGGDDTAERPVDGRDIDGVNNQTLGVYQGRVIDGYLRNARVWLDLDGDFQYTGEPVTVTLDSGIEVIVEGGEPTAMSGPGGRFELDTTELIRDPLEAPNLDPRDYPLVAVAIPGITEEETRAGNVVISQGYTLSAPPGSNNVTPLTTLQHARGDGLFSLAGQGPDELAQRLANINLQGDYIRAGDERAHAYARALARFLGAQFPDDAAARLGEGTTEVLDGSALKLLRLSLVQNASAVIRAVDDAVAGGDYSNLAIEELVLPEVTLDLADPVLLRSQLVRTFDQNADGLPVGRSSLLLESAELSFQYDPAGALRSIAANGCMAPKLQDLVRLANAGGRIAATGMQGLTGVSLAQISRQYYLDDQAVDERLVLDWESRTAAFDTRTSCDPGLASGSELGGPAERTYTWTMNGENKVASITDGTHTLTPDYSNASSEFSGYTLQDGDDNVIEQVTLTGQIGDCSGAIAEEDREASRVISAQQPYTFTGHEPQPAGFPALQLDWDRRDGRDDLLRYGFLDPDIDVTGEGLQWEFRYLADDAFGEPVQTGLVAYSSLARFTGARSCGSEASTLAATDLYGIIESDYSRLSDYLADEIDGS